MTYKLSNQAVGALMLALQKGLMEQTDITELLKDLKFFNTADGLVVENPPVVEFTEKETDEAIA